MTHTEGYLLAVTHARDAGYDIILLAHVLSAAVSLVALVIAGANAWVLRRSGPSSDAIRRYYRPGVNWAGKVLFLVPILGVVLMVRSHGDWSFSDQWIMIGLALWAVAAIVAEMYLWPAERRLQEAVSTLEPVGGGADGGVRTAVTAGTVGDVGAPGDSGHRPESRADTGLGAVCLRVTVLAASLSVVLVAAAVLMVSKP